MAKKLDVVIPPTDKTAEEVAKALFKISPSAPKSSASHHPLRMANQRRPRHRLIDAKGATGVQIRRDRPDLPTATSI